MGLCRILLAAVAVAMSFVTMVNGQGLIPRCQNYQTTSNFTEAYIAKMQANTEGYILRFSNGGSEPCQRLKLIDGNDFNLTFIDMNYTNRYTIHTAKPTSPAKIHLQLLPRLMGADIYGNLELMPLIARDDLIVLVSCIDRGIGGIFITEQVLAMTPYTMKKALSDQVILDIMRAHEVPRLNEIKNISTNCIPGQAAAPSPLPLRLYNLILGFTNPFSGVSSIVPPGVTAMNSPPIGAQQDPSFAANQALRSFREAGISPAQFYAATGGTVSSARPAPSHPLYYQYNPNMYTTMDNNAVFGSNQPLFYNAPVKTPSTAAYYTSPNEVSSFGGSGFYNSPFPSLFEDVGVTSSDTSSQGGGAVLPQNQYVQVYPSSTSGGQQTHYKIK